MQTQQEQLNQNTNEEGVALIVDGREVVFKAGQMELPGMPEESKLRKLAASYLQQSNVLEAEESALRAINHQIMMELQGEGRSGFAYRDGALTINFSIQTPDQKLLVRKKSK